MLITYPLNNIEYTAEDAELFHCTRTSGIYDGGAFPITVTGLDNNITVGAGIGWIRNTPFSGKVVANKESVVLIPELADAVYPRIDAVVIRFDANENGTSIIMKTGVPASEPAAPEVVRTETVYELHRCHVYREAGAAVVAESDITDLSHNAEYCGIMGDPVSSVDPTLTKGGFAADAAAVGAALANLTSGLSITKVWENASPSSSFAAQTVALDLADVDWVAVMHKASTTGSSIRTAFVEVGFATQLINYANIGASGTTMTYTRMCHTTTSSVELKTQYGKEIDGSSTSSDNSKVIPLRIYAIKGVQ